MSLAVMETILQEFGASIGIPDLKPDEEYRCNMQFDDVAVSFELGDDDDSMFVYTLLGAVRRSRHRGGLCQPAAGQLHLCRHGRSDAEYRSPQRRDRADAGRAPERASACHLRGARGGFRQRGGAMDEADSERRLRGSRHSIGRRIAAFGRGHDARLARIHRRESPEQFGATNQGRRKTWQTLEKRRSSWRSRPS